MTAKKFRFDGSGQMAKLDGWATWRHATRTEQHAARDEYLAHRGPAARRRRAVERSALTQPRISGRAS